MIRRFFSISLILLFCCGVHANTPTPFYGQFTDSSGNDNPCNSEYWTNTSSGIKCFTDNYNSGAMSSHPVPPVPSSTPPYYPLDQDGYLLFTDRGDNRELVFLAGAGEYYEIRDAGYFLGSKFSDIATTVKDSGFNMIRLFMYSGVTDDSELPIPLSEQEYPFEYESNKYNLHEYNLDFFNRLINFIHYAQDE